VILAELEVDLAPGDLRINAKAQIRKTARGYRIGNSRLYRSAKAYAAQCLRVQWAGREPLQGPLSVLIVEEWPRLHRQGPAYGLPLGDLDAPLKGILDALEAAGVVGDDAQVVELRVSKRHSKPGRIRVVVEQLPP
jgi:Holliday junction resolvase RusA-like endonuclease